MSTPNLDNLKSVRNPSPLQYAILLYGDEQSSSIEDLLDAERAAAELAAMQARIEKLTEYPERLQKAITELESMAASPAFTEKVRILGKIEGVKLALGYFEEMTR